MLLVRLQNATRSRWGSNWPTNVKNPGLRLSRSERSITGRLFRVAWKHLIPTCISKPVKTRESVRRVHFSRLPSGKQNRGDISLSTTHQGENAVQQKAR